MKAPKRDDHTHELHDVSELRDLPGTRKLCIRCGQTLAACPECGELVEIVEVRAKPVSLDDPPAGRFVTPCGHRVPEAFLGLWDDVIDELARRLANSS